MARYGTRGSTKLAESTLVALSLPKGQPLGAIVAHAPGHPFSAEQERTLCAIAAHMVGIVESARFIEAVDNESAPEPHPRIEPGHPGDLTGELVLQGTPASPGIAIGT